jgi:hypothetical protein
MTEKSQVCIRENKQCKLVKMVSLYHMTSKCQKAKISTASFSQSDQGISNISKDNKGARVVDIFLKNIVTCSQIFYFNRHVWIK